MEKVTIDPNSSTLVMAAKTEYDGDVFFVCPYRNQRRSDDPVGCGTFCPLLEVTEHVEYELSTAWTYPQQPTVKSRTPAVHLHCGAGTRWFELEAK